MLFCNRIRIIKPRATFLVILISLLASLLGSCGHLSLSGAGGSVANSDLDELSYEGEILSPVSFVKHEDPRPFKSYIAINVNHKPMTSLREAIEKKIKKGLVRRNESHLTVITPPEVELLSACLSIQELTQMALEENLQQSSFKPICVGEGVVKGLLKSEATYFIVVEAEATYKFRNKVKAQCLKKVPEPATVFNPDLYYPHITLGFTSRDLHIEDGILKGPQTCRYKLSQK